MFLIFWQQWWWWRRCGAQSPNGARGTTRPSSSRQRRQRYRRGRRLEGNAFCLHNNHWLPSTNWFTPENWITFNIAFSMFSPSCRRVRGRWGPLVPERRSTCLRWPRGGFLCVVDVGQPSGSLFKKYKKYTLHVINIHPCSQLTNGTDRLKYFDFGKKVLSFHSTTDMTEGKYSKISPKIALTLKWSPMLNQWRSFLKQLTIFT